MKETAHCLYEKEWQQLTNELSISGTNLQEELLGMNRLLKSCLSSNALNYSFLKRVWRHYIEKLKRGEYQFCNEFIRALKFVDCFKKSIDATDFFLIDTDFFKLMDLYARYPHYLVNEPVKDGLIIESELDILILFEYLFVPYETPVKLVESLDLYNDLEIEFVLDLLNNKDIRNHDALPIYLSKSEVHILKNLPLEIHIKHQYRYFWRLIFVTKCLNKGMSPSFLMVFLDCINIFNNRSIEYIIEAWVEIGAFLMRTEFYKTDYDLIEFRDYFNYKIDENPLYRCQKKSLKALKNDIETWHTTLSKKSIQYHKLQWADKALVNTLEIEGQPYKIIRFANGEELRKEGKELMHCVANYATMCKTKQCEIWSIRGVQENFHFTVELVQKGVEQIRGFKNRFPTAKEYEVLDKIYKKMKWGY